MGHYLARVFLSCGHVDDVPATMHEIKNPMICTKCATPTEIPAEVLDLVLERATEAYGKACVMQ